jgi:signal transduction histidine kinase
MSYGDRLNRRLTQAAVGQHLPRRTVRVRLTLLYGALFLLSGAALLAITYALFVNATGFVVTGPNGWSTELVNGHPVGLSRSMPAAVAALHGRYPKLTASQIAAMLQSTSREVNFAAEQGLLTAEGHRQQGHVLRYLAIESGIALAGMSLLSLVLGWLMAGRVLQPLQDSYEAQRQFVANASHELRTPLTRQRALIQVALADPQASFSSLHAAHERVLASEQQLEQMIDALLALTRGQAGLERREHLDLATIASHALLAQSEAADRDLDVRATLATAPATGDPRLLERLIANLIDNAIRHNTPGGHVDISTGTRDRHAFLAITNTGPAVPPEQIQRLFQPFQRLGATRAQYDSGYGLGLSIVQAIAAAHRADLIARARPQGGLTIEVSFQPSSGANSTMTSVLPWRRAATREPLSEADAPTGG